MTSPAQSAVQAYQEACKSYLDISQLDGEDMSPHVAAIEKVKLEWTAAVARLQSYKEEHEPEVWFHLADAMSKGWGIERDVDEAARLMRAAADAGLGAAMTRMGLLTRQTDPAAALAWYQKAAAAGNASGMVYLGFASREGQGTPCDYTQAAQWFERAAMAGDKHAWVHAGRVYLRHLKNDHEALRCLTAASEAGMQESHLELAFLHEDPQSPLHDMAKAVAWYRKVAVESSSSRARAMIALARCYRVGQGVPIDLDTARDWLQQALESSPGMSAFHKEAKKLLEKWKDEIV